MWACDGSSRFNFVVFRVSVIEKRNFGQTSLQVSCFVANDGNLSGLYRSDDISCMILKYVFSKVDLQ